MRAMKACLVAAMLLLAARAASAQEVIRAIDFRGLRALPEETLTFYLGLEVGAALDEAALDRRIHELWERRLVDDIEVEKLPAEQGGVKLVITVLERPILRSIVYEVPVSARRLITQVANNELRVGIKDQPEHRRAGSTAPDEQRKHAHGVRSASG